MEILPDDTIKYIPNILNYFSKPINSINDIINTFYQGYNSFFRKIRSNYKKEGNDFIKIFPQFKNLLKDINILFPNNKVPTLKTGENKSLQLTRRQVALIFLLSFLNLIKINRNNKKNSFEFSRILDSKFSSCFHFGLCFLNYLTVIGKWLEKNDPILEENITYTRKNIKSLEYLHQKNEIKLCELNLYNKGSLFKGDASYCVDFANKYIGGGVLNGGCVQEEILFAVEPEAIVSLFLMEVMDDCDAIGIYNTIQYSKYKGYGYEFEYVGCLIDDKTPILKHRIIAIDAINVKYSYHHPFYNCDNNQKIIEINRDIHKAYVGFKLPEDPNIPKTIATGNWGCGAFNGNHELKFIQQWIAASFAEVDRLDYYSFGDKKMILVEKYYKAIKEKYKTANALYEALFIVAGIDDNYINNLVTLK